MSSPDSQVQRNQGSTGCEAVERLSAACPPRLNLVETIIHSQVRRSVRNDEIISALHKCLLVLRTTSMKPMKVDAKYSVQYQTSGDGNIPNSICQVLDY